jgi:hypothetical protein
MEFWTGLVCLIPDPACKNFKRFGDGKGAYVNVVAWAESAKHFERRVTAIAKEQLDCIVREMEKVELLESTLQREGCPDEFSPCERLRKDSRMTWCSGSFMFGGKTM